MVFKVYVTIPEVGGFWVGTFATIHKHEFEIPT
jgi:hypothetical protein